MTELIPYFEPGSRPTGYATGTIRGKRLVSISGTPSGGMAGTENIHVKECAGATEVPVAAACFDAVSGDQVALLALRSNAIVPLVAGAIDITAGELVMSDSQGRVVPFVGPVTTTTQAIPDLPIAIGVACEDQATTDADVGVWLI